MVRGNFALVMIMALLAIVASEQAGKTPAKTYYPSTYAFVNVDVFLKNDGLRDETYHCLYGDGPCTDFAAYYKKYALDMLRTNCARCTPRQNETITKARTWYLKNRPEEYYALLAKIFKEARKPHAQKG